MATSTSGSDAEALARSLAEHLEGGASLAGETRGRLLAALVRRYADDWLAAGGRADDGPPPFDRAAVRPEEVAVAAAQMLRTAGVTSFELASLFNV
jgi:hypothetical protein